MDTRLQQRRLWGKVLFYLWNDVFKDYGFSDDEFQTKEGKEIRYPMFYETVVAGQEVNEGLIAQFLNKLLPKSEERTKQRILRPKKKSKRESYHRRILLSSQCSA